MGVRHSLLFRDCNSDQQLHLAGVDFFTDHKDSLPTDPSLLGTARDYLASVPISLWIALAGCGFAFLAYNAFSGMKKITHQSRPGRANDQCLFRRV